MLLLGANPEGEQVFLNPKMANRHGLIAGATGTGKTVTLQVLIEGFSRIGVPVFAADIKGDLSGIALKGKPHPKVDERIEKIGIDGFVAAGNPVTFWDVFNKQGHGVRTTVSEMGPVLISNLLELNDTQEGVMQIAFAVADEQGLLLLDLKDLRAMLNWLSDNRKDVQDEYGAVASQSIAAIQRKLLVLKKAGGDVFFGEPALNIHDLIRTTAAGKGQVNLLDGGKLMMQPRIYSTFLLWLLSELFEELEEVGDPEKPKLVFFFDEAHLLFNSAPKPLLERIEQVVRLIRSKGVGVYFITQNPTDIPDQVLGQLGNRIQHALRAYTPKDIKAVKAAANTFRPNSKFKTADKITQLGVGEALVSTLDKKGRPKVVEQTLMCPPQSQIGPAPKSDIKKIVKSSDMSEKYDKSVDRESAFEILTEKSKARDRAEKEAAEAKKQREKQEKKQQTTRRKPAKRRRSTRQSPGEAMLKSLARAVGSGLGRKLVRGILGGLFGSR